MQDFGHQQYVYMHVNKQEQVYKKCVYTYMHSPSTTMQQNPSSRPSMHASIPRCMRAHTHAFPAAGSQGGCSNPVKHSLLPLQENGSEL